MKLQPERSFYCTSSDSIEHSSSDPFRRPRSRLLKTLLQLALLLRIDKMPEFFVS